MKATDGSECLLCQCGDPECPGGVAYREPFKIHAEYLDENESEVFCYLSVRTTSWTWDGERTDLHDILGLIWAIALRVRDMASVQLISDLGFSGIPSEIYARLLVLRQPGIIGPSKKQRDFFEGLGAESIFADELFQDLFGLPAMGPRRDTDGATYQPEPDWVSLVANRLRLKGATDYEFRVRPSTKWQVFTSIKRGTTVAEFDAEIMDRLRSFVSTMVVRTVDGPESKAFKTKYLANAIPHGKLRAAKKLLEFVEGSINSTASLIVPLDSHLILLGRSTMVAVEAWCGRENFEAEGILIQARREAEAEVFLTDARCVWSEKIDDVRFESLILEILQREPGMHWLRQVGATREGDDGRDFLAEWTVPPTSTSVTGVLQAGGPLNELRNVMVQVKVRNRGISRSDVINIRDTLEHYSCTGFLLVAFPRTTTKLFDHLLAMRQRGTIWVDWWQQSEIESRLRRHADITARYSDIVRLVRT